MNDNLVFIQFNCS